MVRVEVTDKLVGLDAGILELVMNKVRGEIKTVKAEIGAVKAEVNTTLELKSASGLQAVEE